MTEAPLDLPASGALATDMHTHLAPMLPASADVARVDGQYRIGQELVGPASLYEPEKLLAHLRANELERAAVSVPPPFYRQDDSAGRCRSWADMVNDGVLATTRGYDELLPLAYLPLDQPEVARAEYERRRVDRSWVGYVGSAGGGSEPLDDPALDPLWTAMDADGAFLLLHPGSTSDTRLDRYYLANLLGNPIETAVSAAQLVFGDVLRRRPGVRFLLAHCGGAMPALAGRWQRGHDTARPGVAPLELPPAAAVQRFWVDSLAHEPAAIDLAARVLGSDRIVLGSDWPFPMGVRDVRATVAHLDAGTRTRIATWNATPLLAS